MHKIGRLKLEGEVFLAPMADYTNVAFRTLAREYGAALVYTELISAKAITMKSKKTEKMLAVSEGEKPVFLQLFGTEEKDFEKAIKIVEEKCPSNFAGYDLNCGCSVPKAIKGKYGCTLMNEPQNVGRILSAMKNACDKPVTIKMRLGLKEETFIDVANAAIEVGADAICLHPRYGKQGYSGNADWSKISDLVKITRGKTKIIGNGDIKKPEDVLKMKKETECDFEMVGRAAIGNAFFFSEVNDLLEGKKIRERGREQIAREGERMLKLALAQKLRPNDLRPYFIALAKGFLGAGELRNKFGMSKTIEEMQSIFSESFK